MHRSTAFAVITAILSTATLTFTASAQDTGSSSASNSAQTKPADLSPPVKLLEAGTGDKKAIRYSFVKGSESTMTATGSIEMKTSMGGREMPPQKMPPINSTTNAKITEVDSAGNAHLDVSYSGTTVTGPVSGKAVVSHTGNVKSMELTVPADASDTVKKQIEGSRRNVTQYFIPFPDEAVGTGAKWQVTQSISQQGMTIEQQVIYTLKSRAGDVIELEMQMTQTAADQDIESPQMPNMKIHLNSLKGTGAGSGKVALGNVLCTSATMKMTTDIDLTMPQVGQMTQHMEASMSGESKVTPAKP